MRGSVAHSARVVFCAGRNQCPGFSERQYQNGKAPPLSRRRGLVTDRLITVAIIEAVATVESQVPAIVPIFPTVAAEIGEIS